MEDKEVYEALKLKLGDKMTISYDDFAARYNSDPKYKETITGIVPEQVKKKDQSEPSQKSMESDLDVSSSDIQKTTNGKPLASSTEIPSPIAPKPYEEAIDRDSNRLEELGDSPFALKDRELIPEQAKFGFIPRKNISDYTNIDEDYYQGLGDELEKKNKKIADYETSPAFKNLKNVGTKELSGQLRDDRVEYHKDKVQATNIRLEKTKLDYSRQSAINLAKAAELDDDGIFYDEIVSDYNVANTHRKMDDDDFGNFLIRTGYEATKSVLERGMPMGKLPEPEAVKSQKRWEMFGEQMRSRLEEKTNAGDQFATRIENDYNVYAKEADARILLTESAMAKGEIPEVAGMASIQQMKNSKEMLRQNAVHQINKKNLYKEITNMLSIESQREDQGVVETFTKSMSNEYVKLPRQASSLMLSVLLYGDSNEGAFDEFLMNTYEKASELTDELSFPVDSDNPNAMLFGQVTAQLSEIIGLNAVTPVGAKLFTVAMTHDEAFSFLSKETNLTSQEANNMARAYAAMAAPMEYAGARMGMENFGKVALKKMALRIMKSGKPMSAKAMKKGFKEMGEFFVRSSGIEMVEEAATEGTQFAIFEKQKELWNELINKDKNKIIPTLDPEAWWEQFTQNVRAGAAGGLLGGVAGSINVISTPQIKTLESVLLPEDSFKSIKSMAEARLAQGKMTKVEYDNTLQNMNHSRSALISASNVYNKQDKKLAIQLSLAKEEVNKLPDTDITKRGKLSEIDSQLKEIGANNTNVSGSMIQNIPYLKAKYKSFDRVTSISETGETQEVVDGEAKNTKQYQAAVDSAIKDVESEIESVEAENNPDKAQLLKDLYAISRNLQDSNGDMFLTTPTESARRLSEQEKTLGKSIYSAIDVLKDVVSKGRDVLTAEDSSKIVKTLKKKGVDPNSIQGINNLEGLNTRDAIKIFTGRVKSLKGMTEQQRKFVEVQNISENTGVESTIVSQIADTYDKAGIPPKEARNLTALASRMISSISAKTGKTKQEVLDSIDVVGEQKKVSKAAEDKLNPVANLAEVYSDHLSKKEKESIAKLFGAKRWSNKVQTKFIDGFVKSIILGDTNVTDLKSPYNELKKWIKDTVGKTKGTKYDIRLPKGVKGYYGQLIGDFTIAKQMELDSDRAKLNEFIETQEKYYNTLKARQEVEDPLDPFKEGDIEVQEGKIIVKRSRVLDQVKNAKKAIKKVLPNVEIISHETEASYLEAVGSRSNGAFIPSKGEIHINLSIANTTTVGHEVFHALVNDGQILRAIMGDKSILELTKSIKESVDRLTGDKSKRVGLEKEVEETYFDKPEEWNEEFLAEWFGRLQYSFDKLDVSTKNKVKLWLNKVSKKFGLGKVFDSQNITDAELALFLNEMAVKLSEGKAFKQPKLNNQAEPVSNISGKVSESRFNTLPLKNVIRNFKLSNLPNDIIAHITPSDRLTTATVDGIKHLGGIFYAAATGHVWASSNLAKANIIANHMHMNKDGFRYLFLSIMSEGSHMSNVNASMSAVKEFDKLLRANNIDPVKVYERASKAFKTTDLAEYSDRFESLVGKKKTIDSVTKAIETILLSDINTFESRKAFLKSMLGKTKSGMSSFDGIPDFLGFAKTLAEPLVDNVKTGESFVVIRTKGNVKVDKAKRGDKNYHESYPYYINSTEKVETLVLTDAYRIIDLFPEIADKDGNILTKENYIKIHGKGAAIKYNNIATGGRYGWNVIGTPDTKAKPYESISDIGIKEQRFIPTEEATNEVTKVMESPKEAIDGATFNMDGSVYEGGGIVVGVNSKDIKQTELDQSSLPDFIEGHKTAITGESLKAGLFKFEKQTTVSLDLNILAKQNQRDMAIELGHFLEQESLYDMDAAKRGEDPYIHTGYSGHATVKITDLQIAQLVVAFDNNTPITGILEGVKEQRIYENSKPFKNWYFEEGNSSKLVDGEGNVIPMYHGTKQDFDEFGNNRTTRIGGLYFFTPNPEFANRFVAQEGRPRFDTRTGYTEEGHAKMRQEMLNEIGVLMDEKNKLSNERDEHITRLRFDEGHNYKLGEKYNKLSKKIAELDEKIINIENKVSNLHASVMQVYVKATKIFDPRIESHRNLVWSQVMRIKGERDFKGSVTFWLLYEQEAVIRKLKSHGFDSMWVSETPLGEVETLAVFSPNQVKSATGNRGAFNPESSNIREQRPSRKELLLNKPIARAAMLSESTIDYRNNADALELANIDLVRMYTANGIGMKGVKDIMKVLDYYMKTGDPSYLGAKGNKDGKTMKSHVEGIDGSVGSMDKYIAIDNMLKVRAGEMQHYKTWSMPFDWSDGAFRWYIGLFGDSMSVMKNEMADLKDADKLAVMSGISFFKYLNGAAMSATDIELANDSRREMNKFLKNNNLLKDNESNGKFMSRTTFLAMLLAPTTKTHTDLDTWLNTVIGNVKTHIKNTEKGVAKNKSKSLKNQYQRSLDGATEILSYLEGLKESYEGEVQFNWGNIIADIQAKYPKEFELLDRTSKMHKIHAKSLLNYKKKIGDLDTYEGNYHNSRRYVEIGGSGGSIAELNDNYGKMTSSNAAIQDRNTGSMGSRQYTPTWDFVDQQQRSYNMSSRTMYTGAAVRQMDYATDSDIFLDAVNDETGVLAIRKKMQSMVNYASAADDLTMKQSGAKKLRNIAGRFLRFKNQNLISFKQPAVQLSVLSFTMITAPVEYAQFLKDIVDPKSTTPMMRLISNNSSLGARSVSYMIGSAISTKQEATDIALGNATSFISRNLLNNPDYLAATTSWLAFYMQSRKKSLNGEEFSWEEEAKTPNKEAVAYAEMMQQSSQASNVKEAGSNFSQLKGDIVSLAREGLLPFTYFNNSFATNLMTDAKASRHDVDARQRMMGYSTVPLAYAAVRWTARYQILTLIASGIAGLLDPEDPEEKIDMPIVEGYLKMMDSAINESLSRHDGYFDGLVNTMAIQFTGDFVFAGGLFDVVRTPLINNTVNRLDYEFGMVKLTTTNADGEQVDTYVRKKVLYDNFDDVIRHEGQILDVYLGAKTFDYLFPSGVAIYKSAKYAAAAVSGELEIGGKTIYLDDKEKDMAKAMASFYVIAAVIPFQEPKQIAGSVDRTFEQLETGEILDNLADKGLLFDEATVELYKEFDVQLALKDKPYLHNEKMKQRMLKGANLKDKDPAARKWEELLLLNKASFDEISRYYARTRQDILTDREVKERIGDISKDIEESNNKKKDQEN